jgi:hypothetical protein
LTAEQRALWEWLKAQCAWEAAQDRAERLAAGEPFTVASWQVGTHRSRVRAGAPDWLLTPAISGGASSVWVYPDDTISPAEFYGDQRGGTIERISVSSGAALPA